VENTVTRYQTFAAFYPFYLSEHADRRNRRLHFAGTSLVIGISLAALLTGHPTLFWLLPICGYGCAWVGHFFFEHNKPATFQYPLYSLIGDFVMYKDIWIGRVTL
jgi:hypothetical protein